MELKHESNNHSQAGANDFQCFIWIIIGLGFFLGHLMQHSGSWTSREALIGVFWVCQLSAVRYYIDCSQLMSLFDCCQCQQVYQTMAYCPMRNLQQEICKPLLTCSFSRTTSIHCTIFFFFFFCFSARFYLSWNNKPWYTKNVACFLPSLILM